LRSGAKLVSSGLAKRQTGGKGDSKMAFFGITSFETVNAFRVRRGRMLRALIEALAHELGRDVRILDVGGRPDYWKNVGVANIARIELLNLEPSELERDLPPDLPQDLFVPKVGDACDLRDYADASVDLVHSNSVIEHVGSWDQMAAMARELLRVGRAGWVQTPAWSFPIEPHYRVPFMHWFGRPLQARMMSLSVVKANRSLDLQERRRRADRINLLTRAEFKTLFPGKPIYVERLVIPKSYSVYWGPTEAPLNFHTNGFEPQSVRSGGSRSSKPAPAD
jgi:hypothetical protein